MTVGGRVCGKAAWVWVEACVSFTCGRDQGPQLALSLLGRARGLDWFVCLRGPRMPGKGGDTLTKGLKEIPQGNIVTRKIVVLCVVGRHSAIIMTTLNAMNFKENTSCNYC